jgi:hypothetical protein
MKKLIVRIFIVLIVLIVLALLAVHFFLDGAIKKGVETVGPQLTKVDVKLNSVSLSILSGSGKIKGLIVGNPEGYNTPHAISVGTASLAVVPTSIFSDKVIIKSIRVDAPEIIYEGGLTGGDNLHKILENVTGPGGAPNTNATTSPKAQKKLQVDEFVITGAKVIVSLKGTGGFAAPIVIPDIHLANLGQGPEGITAAELTKKVISEISEDVAKAAVKVIGDIGKGTVDAASKAGKDAVDNATKSVKGVTDIFKKKKE